MKEHRDRMHASGGGRLDPNLPHVFVKSPVETVEAGGIAASSRRCAVCGDSKESPIHPDAGDSVQAVRERHGPYGQ